MNIKERKLLNHSQEKKKAFPKRLSRTRAQRTRNENDGAAI